MLVTAAVVPAATAAFWSNNQSDLNDAIATKPALGITVQTHTPLLNSGFWQFPGNLIPANAALGEDQLTAILNSRSDWTATHQSTVLVTVEGQRSRKVIITGMHVRFLSRVAPAAGGTLLVNPAQGGEDDIQIGFDLDEAVPVARALTDTGALSKPYFDNHNVPLASGDTATFGILLETADWDATYDLVLDEIVDGKLTQQTITNGSQHFHTRGIAPSYGQIVAQSAAGSWTTTDLATAKTQMCGTSCAITTSPVSASASTSASAG